MKQLSKFLSVNDRDAVKAVIMAFIGTIIFGALEYLQLGTFPVGAQWKGILIKGLSTGLAYLIKNYFTNNTDQFLKK